MIDIIELTVEKMRSMMERGETTSYELTCAYLSRIARIDSDGPCLNSVLEVNPDAMDIAEAMDRERRRGKVRSPLHGIPVILKDNINTADKLRTTAGSIALADNYAPYDAFITEKMRAAGLVILGKANMTEFAAYMSNTIKSGYSSRGGQVINAYVPGGEVWGSSTGSAVSVSANLCALAVGTETDGSIIWPSFVNSVVGIKPTRGLVSRYGIIPICTAQDTAGPIARTVADCASLLNTLVGEDGHDPATWERGDVIPEDYTAFLDPDGLKGLRIGVNKGYYDSLNDDKKRLFEEAYAAMGRAGAVIVEGTDLPRANCDRVIMQYEFRKCLDSYLSTVNTKCRSLADIIAFYREHPQEGLKYGMSLLENAQYQASGNCTEKDYILGRFDALKKTREDGLDRVLDENALDLLLAPAGSDHSPVSGYPSINVPAGYESDGMPFGVTFIGRAFSEPLLIKAAYAYEQATKHRRPPEC